MNLFRPLSCFSLLAFFFLATGVPDAYGQKPNRKKQAVDKARIADSLRADSIRLATPKTITLDTVAIRPAPVVDTARTETVVAEVVDSVAQKIKRKIKAPIVQVPVTLKSLIIPGVLFSYGALTLNSGPLRDINREVKEVLWDHNPHERMRQYEDYTLLAPAVAVYVLNFAGVKGHNNIVDRSIMYGMANLINNGISFGLKRVGIETRPDSSNNQSFPSGHTSQAFVSAEFARLEYRGISPWPAIGGYAVAIATGFLRMYNNHHWLSDVVAGAGVGIASTRFAYYLYPAIKHRLFHSRKVKGDAMLLPMYNGGGQYGLSLMYRFP